MFTTNFRKNKKLFYSSAACIAVALVLSVFFLAGLFDSWQVRLSDSLFTHKQASKDIVVVAIDDSSLQAIGRWPWNRSVYADYLPILSKAKVVGIDVAFFERSDNDAPLINVTKELGNVIYPVEYRAFSTKEELVGTKILTPLPELQRYAVGLGHINLFTDPDGITRTVAMHISGVEGFDSFSKTIAENFLGRNISVSEPKTIIYFVGRPGTFETISFSNLKNYSSDYFSGKIVLIGATAPDLHDDQLVPTSGGKLMPGVEIHANIVQQLISGTFLEKERGIFVIITIFAISVALGLLFYFAPIWANAVSALAILMAYVIFSIREFDAGTIMNIIYPVFTTIMTFFALTGVYYLIESREKKKIRQTFSRYMSKQVVEEVLKHEVPKLTGEKKEISVLFSDIRGFTSMSEKMKPEQVVSMLNRYFKDMVDIVFKHEGTLDKYIGDAIMATWNSPLEQKDHVMRAIKTGLDMQRVLKKGKKHPFGVGIGIHTGEAVVGNIGSEQRMEYTSIGDTVNTASRLCSKAEAGQILITEETLNNVRDKIIVKRIGEITVKGKAKPLIVYSVIGLKK